MNWVMNGMICTAGEFQPYKSNIQRIVSVIVTMNVRRGDSALKEFVHLMYMHTP